MQSFGGKTESALLLLVFLYVLSHRSFFYSALTPTGNPYSGSAWIQRGHPDPDPQERHGSGGQKNKNQYKIKFLTIDYHW